MEERAPSKWREGTAFDRSPASDLWRHTLCQSRSRFVRLVLLSTLRDSNSGIYAHYGFAQRVGEEAANVALRQSHSQCFSEWLAFSLEEQKADLDLYLSGIESDKKTILDTWVRTKPYRNLIPAAALAMEPSPSNPHLTTLLHLLPSLPA